MKSVRFVLLMMTAVFHLSLVSFASGAGVLYDDFSTARIDENKWDYLEFVREVKNGEYVSSVRSLGISQGARIESPGNPDSVEAVVVLKEITADDVEQCAAMIGQYVFNDCLDCEAGDDTGAIRAQLAVGAFHGALEARWKVERYDDSIDEWQTLGEGSLGEVGLNVTYKLRLDSDKETGTLGFSIGDETAFYSLESETTEPDSPFIAVGSQNIINESDRIASIRATFDDVFVDGILFDDFSGTELKKDKWPKRNALESVREIRNGKCLLKTRNNTGKTESVNLEFQNPDDIDYIEFKGRLNKVQSNDSALARLRSVGRYYSSAENEDITAEIGIGDIPGDETNQLKAFCYLFNEGTGQLIDYYEFGPVSQREYTMSIDYHDLNQFTFSIDNKSKTMTGPDYFGPPNEPYMAIGTKISPLTSLDGTYAPDGFGSIQAEVDDVMVNGD